MKVFTMFAFVRTSVLILTCFAITTESIKCYECSHLPDDEPDEACRTGKNLKKTGGSAKLEIMRASEGSIPVKDGKPYCCTITGTCIFNDTATLRIENCVARGEYKVFESPNTCGVYDFDTFKGRACCCDSDYCNGGSITQSSVLTILAFSLVKLILCRASPIRNFCVK